MARILIPLPARDFDPTETGVPWRILADRGHDVRFATPDGKPGEADPLMVTGRGLGLLAPVLRANADGCRAYGEMSACNAFCNPMFYADARCEDFGAIMLPGGHAKGMRPYLESGILQVLVAHFFDAGKPVAAICHGVLLAARSRRVDGKSVLHGRQTTALTKRMEMTAWRLTALYLGDYYRTYPQPLQDEVLSLLAKPSDFHEGPRSFSRDTLENPATGFTVRDGNYLSARWPGDAHAFALAFDAMLTQPPVRAVHAEVRG
jgi:protease I